jgi:hypothetical protein
MWENFNPAYNFFVLMLSAAGAKLNPPVKVVGAAADVNSNIVIFGPFGEAWKALPASVPKIHFTGENTPPVTAAQLNLGFNHYDMTNENYLRFPLWILEIDWFGAEADKIVNPKPIPLERCTKIFSQEIAKKKKFCAFVVTNPNNPVRNAAFQWLSEYKHVDSAGRLFNNLGSDIFAGLGGGGGELVKHEFLKDYKFCLAYENSAARGYTTEKLLHAKAAGCIPIYWGDEAVERDFSTSGFIDARKFKSPEELIAAVRRIDEDDSEWLKKFSVPALDPYRVAWCQRTMAECARRMFKLGGFVSDSFPVSIGGEAVAVPLAAPAASLPASAASAAPLPAPAASLAAEATRSSFGTDRPPHSRESDACSPASAVASAPFAFVFQLLRRWLPSRSAPPESPRPAPRSRPLLRQPTRSRSTPRPRPPQPRPRPRPRKGRGESRRLPPSSRMRPGSPG